MKWTIIAAVIFSSFSSLAMAQSEVMPRFPNPHRGHMAGICCEYQPGEEAPTIPTGEFFGTGGSNNILTMVVGLQNRVNNLRNWIIRDYGDAPCDNLPEDWPFPLTWCSDPLPKLDLIANLYSQIENQLLVVHAVAIDPHADLDIAREAVNSPRRTGATSISNKFSRISAQAIFLQHSIVPLDQYAALNQSAPGYSQGYFGQLGEFWYVNRIAWELTDNLAWHIFDAFRHENAPIDCLAQPRPIKP